MIAMQSSKAPIALVTGAARGIGLAVCRRLAVNGMSIAAIDSDEAQLDATCEQLRREGFDLLALSMDIGSEQAILTLPQRLGDRFNRVACLVNNAGMSPRDPAGRKIPVIDLSLEIWNRTIQVNLTAAFLLCKMFLPPMLAASHGRIINMSSLGGRTSPSDMTTAVYGTTKAGLIGFTRVLAREVGARGVTVNAICPGRIETSMATAAEPQGNAEFLKRTPVGRNGTPEEVAELVAYLAGPLAGFVTGAAFDINGGAWMG